MSSVIRAHVHDSVLVTTGGGGVGNGTAAEQLALVASLAGCEVIDVVALHSYAPASAIDLQLAAYSAVLRRAAAGTTSTAKRLILQEWGVTGANSTVQAVAFAATAAVAAKHRVPQFFWAMQPSHVPLPSTELAISAPAPPPSPGTQRYVAFLRHTAQSYVTLPVPPSPVSC
jgi:hypothetical protein